MENNLNYIFPNKGDSFCTYYSYTNAKIKSFVIRCWKDAFGHNAIDVAQLMWVNGRWRYYRKLSHNVDDKILVCYEITKNDNETLKDLFFSGHVAIHFDGEIDKIRLEMLGVIDILKRDKRCNKDVSNLTKDLYKSKWHRYLCCQFGNLSVKTGCNMMDVTIDSKIDYDKKLFIEDETRYNIGL